MSVALRVQGLGSTGQSVKMEVCSSMKCLTQGGRRPQSGTGGQQLGGSLASQTLCGFFQKFMQIASCNGHTGSGAGREGVDRAG